MISTTVRPRFGSRLVCQSCSNLRADVGVLDRLVVGKDHRDEAGVGGALHVVLAAQRMQPGAGAADLARHQRQRDQAARVVGAVDVLRNPHAPEDDRRPGAGIGAGDLAQGRGVDAAQFGHLLRRVVFYVLAQRLEILGMRLHVLPVVKPLLDDGVQQRVQHCDVASRLELQHLCRIARHELAARVHHVELGAALRGLLEEGRRDGVIFGRARADHDDDLGVGRGGKRRRDRARADPLHQRRHRRRVTQPRAVIDVVGAEPGAHQLLEQIGLFVRPLGRAEPGQTLAAMFVADAPQTGGGAVERLLPRRGAEMRVRVGRIDRDVMLRDAVLADQGLGQPVRMMDVIEAETALDAEPVVVGRPVLAFDRDDAVVLDVIDQLAADAAIRADALDLALRRVRVNAVLVDEARRHQGAGRAGLHALAARDAGRLPHRVVEIEHDLFAWPRPAMPITSLTCTSRQARTQSVHWMQASSCTAIAGWLRSGAGAARCGKRLSRRLRPGRPTARTANPARAPLRGRADRRSAVRRPVFARPSRARWPNAPSCPGSGGGCTTRRARARPRSRPCRRGNCRRPGSPASAASIDAGSRRRCGSRPARSSPPARPRPRSRQA